MTKWADKLKDKLGGASLGASYVVDEWGAQTGATGRHLLEGDELVGQSEGQLWVGACVGSKLRGQAGGTS